MSDEMTMAFSFPDQSHSFVHGYEAGKLGARMEAGEPEINHGFEEGFPLHEENIELVHRMAAYYGYTVELGNLEDGWRPVRLAKSARPRPALKVVS